MKEAIEQVLSNETYTTNEEKVDAISKELAKLVIPKDKYNELSNRLQKTESELASVRTQYDDYKKSKMTDDEKNAEEKKKFEEQKKAHAIEKSDLAVQKLLLKNGIEIKDDDTELKETLSTIVSEDYDKSIKLANGFINLINKTKDNTAKETTTKLLGSTPAPVGGTNSSSSLSKVEILNQQLQEALKNKDSLLQTQLMTQIFQEQQKSNI